MLIDLTGVRLSFTDIYQRFLILSCVQAGNIRDVILNGVKRSEAE
jgi:hypothetical protein